jgi:hypothetical protein
MRRRPIVQRLIIWDRQSVSRGDLSTLVAQLGSRWKLIHDDTYTPRRHFNWQEMMNAYRRLEFVRLEPERIPASATRPASAAQRKAMTRPPAPIAPESPW